MAKFSLDDILAEVESKRDGDERSSTSVDVDDILKDILGESKPTRIKPANNTENKADAANKARIAEELRRAELEDKRRIAEEKRKAELEEKKRKAAEEKSRKDEERVKRLAAEQEARRKAAEEEARRKLAEQQARRKAAEEEARRKAEERAEKQRQEELKKRKAEEEAAEKARIAEEEKKKREAEEARLAALDEEERKKAEKEAAEKRRLEEESEKRFATKNIVFEDVPIELPDTKEPEKAPAATTAEIELEKTLRQQKLETESQKLIMKESTLEDPDDFISSMNPYEFGTDTGYTQMIETLPSQKLSGDTVSIAGNELKNLSSRSSLGVPVTDDKTVVMTVMPKKEEKTFIDPDKTIAFSEEVTEYEPKGSSTREIPPRNHTPEEEKLILSVNKTIEQKRISDIRAKTAVPKGTAEIGKVNIPTRGVEVEVNGATMPRTGQIPISDPVIAEQKAKELISKRKRSISSFVLEDISDDVDYYDDEEAEEFDTEDDDGRIWVDLVETHKGLRFRFIILTLITLFLGIITMIQDFSVMAEAGNILTFELFGAQVDFLDKRVNPDGFIYLNLILGVVGMALCSTVVTNGLIKIFKGRADCDSVCSVACVLSVLGAVLHLTNTDYLQRSRAFLFIVVALAGLLFNTLGKLIMINRAKKNFRFISSDMSHYYADVVDSQSEASALTRGVINELPYLVTMRKTELLTDFLRKSYCEDKADRISRILTPASLIVGAVSGILAYFIPNGMEGMENNIYWASTVLIGIVAVMLPFSVMFLVNNPFRRASKAMEKSGCALLGYTSAEEFGETNAVLVDANTLFPKSSIECTNLKPCKLQNSYNNVSLDQAIILAASLAIKSGSILSGLFYEMIGGNRELLADIDGCVYEDNMGVMGWYGNKRLIMGNRDHMKHHSIKVPEMSAIAKYSRNGSDSVYLAVGGELVIMFFIRLTPNPRVRKSIHGLMDRGVSLIIKSTDSLVTVGKIADVFDADPEKIKVLGSNLHETFAECTKYTSRGSGALSCNGSFVSLASGIITAKKLLSDINVSQMAMIAGVFLGALLLVFLMFSVKTLVFSPAVIICYNLFWLIVMLLLQSFRRYN